MTGFNALEMEDVRRWQSGFSHQPGLLDTLTNWVGLARIMLSVQLVTPSFVRVRGCVLLPWSYEPESFDQWWEELNGDCRRIEEVLNHLHLWDLLADGQADESALRSLGETLQMSWGQQLRIQMPDRSFDVAFTEDREDYGPTVSILSL